MDEEYYKLIPEEGKHLANSRKTEGANRGVYLDDKTNKPNGAGEFIKVDPAELTSDDIVKNAIRLDVLTVTVQGAASYQDCQ